MADYSRKQQAWLECVVCGTGFKPKNQVQTTCSKKCSRERAVQRTATWRAANEIPAVPDTRICACGVEFKPTNMVHISCTRECADRRRNRQSKDWKGTYGRDSYILRKYELTRDDFDRMYDTQEGKCAICEQSLEQLCVDHNHVTGTVRGLLCRQCNAALGAFEKYPGSLQAAILYLEKYKE